MASLGQIEQATLTANSDVSSITDSTRSTLGSIDTADMGQKMSYAHDAASDGWFRKGKFDFVGINMNGIDEMNLAIDKYCNDVNEILGQMVTTADPTGTFAGEYANAIKDFMTSIQNSCMYNVDALKAFKEDMNQVAAAMKAKDASVLGNISEDASSINSASSNNTN